MKIKFLTLFISILLFSVGSSVNAQGKAPDAGQGKKYLNERIIVKFKGGDLNPDVEDDIFVSHKVKKHKYIKELKSYVVTAPSTDDTLDVIEKLKKRKDVEYAEPDYYCEPVGQAIGPNDPQIGSQWQINNINLQGAWAINQGSPNIIVAVIDSGCKLDHEDLKDKYVGGYNFFDNNTNAADVYGHGTAVAGCIAPATNNGIGIAGTAYNCRIMPLRVSDSTGYAFWSTIATAIQYAANNGARVANASFSCGDSSTIQSAARYFNSKGGVFCCSAGNQATVNTTPNTPEVIIVGATDSSNNLAGFSNSGSNMDVVAPGVAVYTTNNQGGYGWHSGTSFSSPITAGVCALILSYNSTLTPSQVDALLKNTATDLGDPGPDTKFAYGLINAEKALQNMTGSIYPPPPPPPPGPSPTGPQITIRYPQSNQTISGNYEFIADVVDASTILAVSFTVDAQYNIPATKDSGNNTWRGRFDTTKLPNDVSHTFKVYAKATLENAVSSYFFVNNIVTVDTTPPIISITSPVSGAAYSRGLITVNANASDNVGVIRVELYVDGKYISNDTASPFSLNWNAKRATFGSHTIVMKAFDAAGNSASSAPVTITIK
jgi:hypothetical protein